MTTAIPPPEGPLSNGPLSNGPVPDGPLPDGVTFDPAWYADTYPDVAAAGLDPHTHFVDHGFAEGRLPCAEERIIRASGLLDVNYYIMMGEDVRRAQLDPVGHFCRHGSAEKRRPNPYFDPVWYARTYAPPDHLGTLAHYVLFGEREGMRPSLLFDPAWYREACGLAAGQNALAHYLAHRATQTVSPLPCFDVAFYVAANGATLRPHRDAFAHYLTVGSARDADPAPWFDAKTYRRTMMPAHSNESPVLHLVRNTARGFRRAALPDTPGPGAARVAPDPGTRSALVSGLDAAALAALHLALASPFIDETLADPALGAPPDTDARAGIYASYPPLERPTLTPFLDPIWYIARHRKARVGGERDPLLHFLRVGATAGLDPHPLINIDYMRAHSPRAFADQPVDAAVARLLRDARVDPSPYFSASFYLSQLGDNLEAADSPLRHYLTRGMAQGLLPNRFLDLDWYMGQDAERPQNPAAALRHFVLEGDRRGDPPGPDFDGTWYLRRYADVRDGKLGALRHYLEHGAAENRQRAQVQRGALPHLPPHGGNPEDGPAGYARMAQLHAGRRQARDTADAAALDCAPHAPPLPEPPATPGDHVLLLAPGWSLAPASLARLAAVLDRDPSVAMVAPTLAGPDGLIVESGRAIDNDGDIVRIGAGRPASAPEYARLRDVHAVAGTCVLVRGEAVGGDLEPAQFEHACLAAHAAGWRVVVEGAACATAAGMQADAVSPLDAAAASQRIAVEWRDTLRQLNETRVLALYLPQYHPTPENDRWWGRGFTDWTNVSQAQPSYGGHYQPHVPADLGYYDLRVAAVFAEQAKLARRYGVDGFCVYRYYLDGRRMLHEPFEAMLRDPAIAFPFCVAWANENWTRRWDGGNGEMLAAQLYDDATLALVIADACRLSRDPRYLHVRGRPILAVYRPLALPDPVAFAERCRDAFAADDGRDVHLVAIESLEGSGAGIDAASIGFDAAMEFPPHGPSLLATDRPNVLKEDWSGVRFDYAETVLAFTQAEIADRKRHPAVFPSWDNTPRQPLAGITYAGADPALFQFYVERKLDEIHRSALGCERLLFVNAWNEWAEGAHLEPDMAFGHRWLEALRAARERSGFV